MNPASTALGNSRSLSWSWVGANRIEPENSSTNSATNNQLLLILGLPATEIDYLGQLFTRHGSGIQAHSSPTSRLLVQLGVNSPGADAIDLGFQKSLSPDHPILRTYQRLLHKTADGAGDFKRLSHKLRHASVATESRGLLHSEALIRQLGCKALFIVDDPIALVEQAINARSFAGDFLNVESIAALQAEFLLRFLPRDYRQIRRTYKQVRQGLSPGRRVILRRVLAAALMQHMFRVLAVRYPNQVRLLDAQVLRTEPSRLRYTLRDFGDPEWDLLGEQVLHHQAFRPYSGTHLLWRHNWPSPSGRQLKLDDAMRRACQELLGSCGLLTLV